MDLSDVKARQQRRCRILFSGDSPCLSSLRSQLMLLDRTSTIVWALYCAKATLEDLELIYPEETRPRQAVDAAWLWASGEIKMPVARKLILSCHSAAKEMDIPYAAALCHAIGQASSTVHTPSHALGLPVYELTALVLNYGLENAQERIADKIEQYMSQIKCSPDIAHSPGKKWAPFLQK